MMKLYTLLYCLRTIVTFNPINSIHLYETNISSYYISLASYMRIYCK